MRSVILAVSVSISAAVMLGRLEAAPTVAPISSRRGEACLAQPGRLEPARASDQDKRTLLLTPDAPEFQQPAPAVGHVALESNRGTILIEVVRDWAPRAADRFVNLVRYGYYDENRFFRVRPGYWTQFGINGDPAVAKAWRSRTLPDDPFRQANVRGTVAFAFAVANGRTTQVFFNLRDNSATHDHEQPPFTPFGRVIAGMEIVDALNAEHGEGLLDFIKRAVIVRSGG